MEKWGVWSLSLLKFLSIKRVLGVQFQMKDEGVLTCCDSKKIRSDENLMATDWGQIFFYVVFLELASLNPDMYPKNYLLLFLKSELMGKHQTMRLKYQNDAKLFQWDSNHSWKWMVGIRSLPLGMAYSQGRSVNFRECIPCIPESSENCDICAPPKPTKKQPRYRGWNLIPKRRV